jgi:hypothetical protein
MSSASRYGLSEAKFRGEWTERAAWRVQANGWAGSFALLVALEAEHEPDPGDRDGPIELARWKHDADPPIE